MPAKFAVEPLIINRPKVSLLRLNIPVVKTVVTDTPVIHPVHKENHAAVKSVKSITESIPLKVDKAVIENNVKLFDYKLSFNPTKVVVHNPKILERPKAQNIALQDLATLYVAQAKSQAFSVNDPKPYQEILAEGIRFVAHVWIKYVNANSVVNATSIIDLDDLKVSKTLLNTAQLVDLAQKTTSRSILNTKNKTSSLALITPILGKVSNASLASENPVFDIGAVRSNAVGLTEQVLTQAIYRREIDRTKSIVGVPNHWAGGTQNLKSLYVQVLRIRNTNITNIVNFNHLILRGPFVPEKITPVEQVFKYINKSYKGFGGTAQTTALEPLKTFTGGKTSNLGLNSLFIKGILASEVINPVSSVFKYIDKSYKGFGDIFQTTALEPLKTFTAGKTSSVSFDTDLIPGRLIREFLAIRTIQIFKKVTKNAFSTANVNTAETPKTVDKISHRVVTSGINSIPAVAGYTTSSTATGQFYELLRIQHFVDQNSTSNLLGPGYTKPPTIYFVGGIDDRAPAGTLNLLTAVLDVDGNGYIKHDTPVVYGQNNIQFLMLNTDPDFATLGGTSNNRLLTAGTQFFRKFASANGLTNTAYDGIANGFLTQPASIYTQINNLAPYTVTTGMSARGTNDYGFAVYIIPHADDIAVGSPGPTNYPLYTGTTYNHTNAPFNPNYVASWYSTSSTTNVSTYRSSITTTTNVPAVPFRRGSDAVTDNEYSKPRVASEFVIPGKFVPEFMIVRLDKILKYFTKKTESILSSKTAERTTYFTGIKSDSIKTNDVFIKGILKFSNAQIQTAKIEKYFTGIKTSTVKSLSGINTKYFTGNKLSTTSLSDFLIKGQLNLDVLNTTSLPAVKYFTGQKTSIFSSLSEVPTKNLIAPKASNTSATSFLLQGRQYRSNLGTVDHGISKNANIAAFSTVGFQKDPLVIQMLIPRQSSATGTQVDVTKGHYYESAFSATSIPAKYFKRKADDFEQSKVTIAFDRIFFKQEAKPDSLGTASSIVIPAHAPMPRNVVNFLHSIGKELKIDKTKLESTIADPIYSDRTTTVLEDFPFATTGSMRNSGSNAYATFGDYWTALKNGNSNFSRANGTVSSPTNSFLGSREQHDISNNTHNVFNDLMGDALVITNANRTNILRESLYIPTVVEDTTYSTSRGYKRFKLKYELDVHAITGNARRTQVTTMVSLGGGSSASKTAYFIEQGEIYLARTSFESTHVAHRVARYNQGLHQYTLGNTWEYSHPTSSTVEPYWRTITNTAGAGGFARGGNNYNNSPTPSYSGNATGSVGSSPTNIARIDAALFQVKMFSKFNTTAAAGAGIAYMGVNPYYFTRSRPGVMYVDGVEVSSSSLGSATYWDTNNDYEVSSTPWGDTQYTIAPVNYTDTLGASHTDVNGIGNSNKPYFGTWTNLNTSPFNDSIRGAFTAQSVFGQGTQMAIDIVGNHYSTLSYFDINYNTTVLTHEIEVKEFVEITDTEHADYGKIVKWDPLFENGVRYISTPAREVFADSGSEMINISTLPDVQPKKEIHIDKSQAVTDPVLVHKAKYPVNVVTTTRDVFLPAFLKQIFNQASAIELAQKRLEKNASSITNVVDNNIFVGFIFPLILRTASNVSKRLEKNYTELTDLPTVKTAERITYYTANKTSSSTAKSNAFVGFHHFENVAKTVREFKYYSKEYTSTLTKITAKAVIETKYVTKPKISNVGLLSEIIAANIHISLTRLQAVIDAKNTQLPKTSLINAGEVLNKELVRPNITSSLKHPDEGFVVVQDYCFGHFSQAYVGEEIKF